MKLKLNKWFSILFGIFLLIALISPNTYAAGIIRDDGSQFAPKQNLKILNSTYPEATYSFTGNVRTYIDSDGYRRFSNITSNDKVIVNYPEVGTYLGEKIGCEITFSDFRLPSATNTGPKEIKIKQHSFYLGYDYLNINYLITTYRYFYCDTKATVNIKDAYMTFSSLNETEYVGVKNNNASSTGYATSNTFVVKKTMNLYNTNYEVFYGSTSDGWQDWIGGSRFEDAAISIPISGTSHSFVVGCEHEKKYPYGFSVWNAPSSYYIGIGRPENPTKTVNDKTSITAHVSDTITYKISQKTNIWGVDTTKKYSSLQFIDVLPKEVDYISAKMLNGSGQTIDAGTLNYTSSTRTVSYDFSYNYLQNTMAYNGEIYTLEITCKINNNAIGGIGFNNKGTVKFNNLPLDSNIVTVTPYYNITTEVVNGTITGNQLNITAGQNRTINYSPNTGYMLQSITVDGIVQNWENYKNSYAFNNIRANHHIKVIYEQIPNKTITVTKIWNDENNIYGTRPSSLKITILQNGVNFKNVTLNSSNTVAGDNNKWQITVAVPQYNNYREEYAYTIREDTSNVNLRYFYDTPLYDQNTLTVTNTAQFIPTESNEHPEYKIIVNKDIIDENGNTADANDFNQVALDINDTYNFAITLKELNRTVTNSGTSLVESYNGYSGKVFNGIVTNKEDLVFNLGDQGYGKYEISENANQYFDFVDIEKLNDEFNTSGASFSKENGKYYITLSGLTGQFEQISVKVTNKIKPDRPYNETEDKENLFKI